VSAATRAVCDAPPVGDAFEAWERHADWWQKEFTDGIDAEYEEQILPLAVELLAGCRRVVDIGCGEGQVARRLAGCVGEVVGAEPVGAQIGEAACRGGGPVWARAAAAHLPFRGDSFDGAVACLVFEHITEVDEAIREVARVLRPGGRFALFLNHPLLQTPNSGWIDDQILDPPEQYWRVGPYLVESVVDEEICPGVILPFVHRPLGRYVNALAGAGLVLSRMLEPAPPAGFLARVREYGEAATIPRLLVLLCERSSDR